MIIISEDKYNQIKDLDFGCDFRGDSCVAYRNRGKKVEGICQCCCRNCARKVGYLKIDKANPEFLPEEYKTLFDDKLGFYRERAGCILPTNKKSEVCALYTCKDSNATDEVREFLESLRGK